MIPMAIGHFLGLTVIFLNPILVSLLVSSFLDDQLTILVAEFPTSSHGGGGLVGIWTVWLTLIELNWIKLIETEVCRSTSVTGNQSSGLRVLPRDDGCTIPHGDERYSYFCYPPEALLYSRRFKLRYAATPNYDWHSKKDSNFQLAVIFGHPSRFLSLRGYFDAVMKPCR